MRRAGFLVAGALVQLGVWLALRPDLAGPQWMRGPDLELWLVLEAVSALGIGLLAPDRVRAAGTVLLGWALQMIHFVAVGEHYDGTLWGVGVFLQVVLAAASVAMALSVRRWTGDDRRVPS